MGQLQSKLRLTEEQRLYFLLRQMYYFSIAAWAW